MDFDKQIHLYKNKHTLFGVCSAIIFIVGFVLRKFEILDNPIIYNPIGAMILMYVGMIFTPLLIVWGYSKFDKIAKVAKADISDPEEKKSLYLSIKFFQNKLIYIILFFNALVYLLTFKDQFSMLYSISVIVFFMNYPTKHCYIRNFEHDDFDDHYESDLKKE